MATLRQYFKNNYALEWYQYGLKTKNDAIIKFTMHWIAFNWLYGESQGGSEREQIKAYCEQWQEELLSYPAFDTPEIQIFLEGPVYDSRGRHKNESQDIFKELTTGEGLDRVVSLLKTIYQVRCNLFHGQKMLHNDRDVCLVESSSVILEGYLNAVLNYDKRYRFSVK